MKIATWNVERLKHRAEIERILSYITDGDADILILTETDDRMTPVYPYMAGTAPAVEAIPSLYTDTEKRVMIF